MAKVLSIIKVICNDCGYIWDEEDEYEGEEEKCPRCESTEITQLDMTRY